MALLLAASTRAGWSGTSPQHRARDLTEASLEELMHIEVTSVAKKEQKLSAAAAAIYVITQEDIRRSGATSIPEVLRLAPGLEVARINSNQWAVTARGFNGRFANKMLVLVDGRSVYTPLFSGVYWDTLDTLLEDIDRIEVIRGPGATMWGANAVNGVINIITKPARETQGGIVTVGGGTEDRGYGSVRYGAKLGPKAWYRGYSKYLQRTELRTPSGQGAGDEWNQVRGGFRIDWDRSARDGFSFEGDAYRGHTDQRLPLPSWRPPFAEIDGKPVVPLGGSLLGRWMHRCSDRSDMALQFYYDRYRQWSYDLGEDRPTLDVDFQQRTEWSRHEILWGAGTRFTSDRLQQGVHGSIVPRSRTDRLSSAFVQDELRLIPERLWLTVGSKFEHNGYTGFELQPNVRVLWMPNPRQAFWASVSRAVRTPARVDRGLRVDLAVFPGAGGVLNLLTLNGSAGFRSETLRAYELGYRLQPSPRFSVDLATYYNVYDHLHSDEPGPPYLARTPTPHQVIPTYFANKMKGEGYGAEIATKVRIANPWIWSIAYTWLDLQLHPYRSSRSRVAQLAAGESPAQQVQWRSYLDLPHRLQFDTGLYYVGSLPAQNIPAYTRIDTRLGWRPGDYVEFSAGVQNVLDKRHPEFISVQEGPGLPTEVGRSLYGKVTWRFQ